VGRNRLHRPGAPSSAISFRALPTSTCSSWLPAFQLLYVRLLLCALRRGYSIMHFPLPRHGRAQPQNGHVERLIGSIRRECMDHTVVFGEAHLRRILRSYAYYYNELRTHLALSKDAPFARTVQRVGQITALPLLGGLHHQFVRT